MRVTPSTSYGSLRSRLVCSLDFRLKRWSTSSPSWSLPVPPSSLWFVSVPPVEASGWLQLLIAEADANTYQGWAWQPVIPQSPHAHYLCTTPSTTRMHLRFRPSGWRPLQLMPIHILCYIVMHTGLSKYVGFVLCSLVHASENLWRREDDRTWDVKTPRLEIMRHLYLYH